jgi:hypothetical protein
VRIKLGSDDARRSPTLVTSVAVTSAALAAW